MTPSFSIRTKYIPGDRLAMYSFTSLSFSNLWIDKFLPLKSQTPISHWVASLGKTTFSNSVEFGLGYKLKVLFNSSKPTSFNERVTWTVSPQSVSYTHLTLPTTPYV